MNAYAHVNLNCHTLPVLLQQSKLTKLDLKPAIGQVELLIRILTAIVKTTAKTSEPNKF